VRLEAKIFDSTGQEVDDYELEVDGEDFTFKFKKPHREEETGDHAKLRCSNCTVNGFWNTFNVCFPLPCRDLDLADP
jgi:hypothetical protein